MSAANPPHDPPTPPRPEHRGWVRVADLKRSQSVQLPVQPRSGACSVRLCSAPTTAAIRRGPSTTRAAYWQLYCAEHAYERGIDTREGRLDWVDGFLRTRSGGPWQR